MNHNVYLGLGSNLGDRRANLQAALAAFPPQLEVLATSPIYETEPWGYRDQDEFLNQAVLVSTDLAPAELLVFLKGLEKQLGRVPTFKNGPREIDIDIIFYDDAVIEEEGLHIPHPHMAERVFVLAPLNDIAPDFPHPILQKKVSQLYLELEGDPLEPLEMEAS